MAFRHKGWLLAVSIAVACLPTAGHALGLGDIRLQSALNERFAATIELISAEGVEADDLRAAIAPGEDFERAGLDRPYFLQGLRFEPFRGHDGRLRIRVTSAQPVQEPFVSFLLELKWPKGRLLKEYAVLVDLPVAVPAAPPVVTAPAAQRPAPEPEIAVAPAPTDPEDAAGGFVPATGAYGPTQAGETAWKIAERVRPDGEVSIEQSLMALVSENPDAFVGGNANRMQAGRILKVPDKARMLALSHAQARAEFQRHNTEWRSGVRAVAAPAPLPDTSATPPVATSPTPSPAPASATEPVVPSESRLKLVAPVDKPAATAGAPAAGVPASGQPVAPGGVATSAAETAEIQRLRQDLALAGETAETARLENEAMRNRMNELEGQLAELKRLLTVESPAAAAIGKPEIEPVPAPTTEPKAVAPDTASSARRSDEPQPDFVWTDPSVLVIGAAGVAALGLLGIAMVRRRRQEHLADVMIDERSPSATSAQSHFQDRAQAAPVPVAEHADPLEEAGVYLTYGRYDQAEATLKAAMANEPQRLELAIKLFEVYRLSGNATAYEALASASGAALAVSMPRQWQEVVEYGRQMIPNSRLFGGVAHNDVPADTGAASGPVDFGRYRSMAEGAAESTTSQAGAASPEEALYENAAVSAQRREECNTKLDLAAAYVDIGDQDGARAILGEVMEQGDQGQRQKAEELMRRIRG